MLGVDDFFGLHAKEFGLSLVDGESDLSYQINMLDTPSRIDSTTTSRALASLVLGLVSVAACARDLAAEDPFGREYFHGIETVFYLRPADPKFRYLREKLAGVGLESAVWTGRLFQESSSILGISAEDLDSIAIGVHTNGLYAGLAVGKSRSLRAQRGPFRGARRQVIADEVCWVWRNTFAHAYPTPTTVLYGTESEVRLAFKRPQQTKAMEGLPSLAQLGNPQVAMLVSAEEYFWRISSLNVKDDGFDIQVVTRLRPSSSPQLREYVDANMALRKRMVEKQGIAQRTTLSFDIDADRTTETIKVRNLQAAEWKNALPLMSVCLGGEAMLANSSTQMQFQTKPEQADFLIAQNSQLLRETAFGEARRALEKAVIRQISSCIFSEHGIKALATVLAQPGSKAIEDEILLRLSQCNTPRATILYDQAIAARLTVPKKIARNSGFRAVRQHALHGEDETSAAACRILSAHHFLSAHHSRYVDSARDFMGVIREVAEDTSRSMFVRATANKALVDAGIASITGVDMTALVPVKPLHLKSADPAASDAVVKALRQLDRGDAQDQVSVIKSLTQMDVVPERRGAVIDMLVSLLRETDMDQLVRYALAHWMNRESLPVFAEVFGQYQHEGHDLTNEDFLSILNDMKFAGHVVSVLDACRVIAAAKPGIRTLCRKAIEQMIAAGFETEDIPALMDLQASRHFSLSDSLKRKMIELNDPRLIRFLVSELNGHDDDRRKLARSALIRFGPIAEVPVRDAFEQEGVASASDCMQILQEIGSARSLPVLLAKQKTFNPNAGVLDLQQVAQSAIDTIKTANRKPVDLSNQRLAIYLTRESIRLAEQMVAFYQSNHGMLPDEKIGNRIVQEIRDGWDQPLRYEVVDENRFAIRSGASDHRLGNQNDIVEQTPSPIPGSVDEAIAGLVTGDRSQAVELFAWLKDKELDATQSTNAVIAAIRLLNHSHVKQQAFDWLASHLNGSHEVLLEKSLTYYPAAPCRDKDFVTSIEALRELVAESGRSIARVNPPVKPAADSIAKANPQPELRPARPNSERRVEPGREVPGQRVPDRGAQRAGPRSIGRPKTDSRKPSVDDYIAELKSKDLSESDKRNAVWQMSRMTFNDEQRDELFSLLPPLIDWDDSTISLAAFDTLQQAGFKDTDIPILKKLLEIPYLSRSVGDELVRLVNDEVIEFLTDRLASPKSNTDPAFSVVKDIGDSAESCLWSPAQNDNVAIQGRALSLIGLIGTQKSIDYLRGKDFGTAQAQVDLAIRQIEARSKKQ